MAKFEEYLPGLFPTFLRGPWGLAWGAKHGAAADRVLDGAKDAVKAGFAPSAPVDALPYLLADGRLEGLPGEGASAQRARLAVLFDVWKLAGTRDGLELAASLLGWEGYALRSTREWLPDAPPDGDASRWARWWLVLPEAAHGYALDLWDGAGNWDDGGTWDTDATPEEVSRLTRLLRAQTNARDLGHVRLLFGDGDGDVWGPDDPFDNGVWADDAATFTELET